MRSTKAVAMANWYREQQGVQISTQTQALKPGHRQAGTSLGQPTLLPGYLTGVFPFFVFIFSVWSRVVRQILLHPRHHNQ